MAETTLANPEPDATLLTGPLHWVAAGDHPARALAVVSRQPLLALSPRSNAGLWSVAAETPDGSIVLGVWTWYLPGTSYRGCYADSLIATLYAWELEIRSGRVTVAGDFNFGPALARNGVEPWFGWAASVWESTGLRSAYHEVHGEPLDRPGTATHYWRYDRASAFHIDDVLMAADRLRGVRSVQIGSYEQWCAVGSAARSDHAPVIVDLV